MCCEQNDDDLLECAHCYTPEVTDCGERREDRHPVLNPKRFVAAVVLASCASAVPVFAARPDFLLFMDPGKRFSVEFPKTWRWMVVAGSGEALVTFVEAKSEAAVIVEHARLGQPLAPADITDVFAQAEIDWLKELQPRASGFASKTVTVGGKRLIVIDYTRPGLDKVVEIVRQYSIPAGQDLYRITCMSIANLFAKYEATFASVAESLKPATELGAQIPQPK